MVLEETSNGHINIIRYQSKPSDKTILCIHGFCCDARIFNYLGNRLSEAGFNVLSIDIFGHGKSDGIKGDPDFEKCLQSINEIIEKLRINSKVFILAHSTGCTFALWYARNFKNSCDGLILMSPYIRVNVKKRSEVEPNLPIFFYLLFRRIFTSKSKVKITNVLTNYVRVGGEEIAQMLQDKEINFHYSYRYLIDVLVMRNSKVAKVLDVKVPTLILHGKKDRNVYPQISETFYKMVNSKDKKIELFDCDHWFYDAVFYNQFSPKYSEESRMSVIQSIKNWLAVH